MADGTVIIDTKLDNKGIDKGIDDIRKQAAKLAHEYKKSGMSSSEAWKKAWSEIERSSSNGTKKVKADMNSIASLAKKCAGILAGAFVLDKVKDYTSAVVKAGIGYNALSEQAQVAWSTILGSNEAASQMMDKITDYAAKTPFTKMGVDTMAKQLTNAGFQGQALFDQLDKIGDMGSAFGIQEDSLREMVRQYAQVQQAQVAYTEDLNILQDRGIPIFKALGEVMGVPISQVKKLASEGKVTADVYNKALDSIASKTKGAMENQSKTFNGMISTMEDNLSVLIGLLTKPMFDKMKAGLENLIPKVDKLTEATEIFINSLESGNSISESLYKGLDNLFGEDTTNKIFKIANAIGLCASAIIGASTSIASLMIISKVTKAFSVAREAIATYEVTIGAAGLVQGVLNGQLGIAGTLFGILTGKIKLATLAQAAFKAVFGAVNVFSVVIVAISALIGAFIYLWKTSESFRNFWIGLWNSIKSLTASAINGIKNIIISLGESLKNLGERINNFISPALLVVCEKAKKAWSGFKNIISSLISKFLELKDATLGAIGSGIINLIEKAKKVWGQLKESISSLADKLSFLSPLISSIGDALVRNFTTARGLALTFVGIISNLGLRFLGLTGPIGLVASLLITLTTSFFKLSGFSAEGITNTFENLANKISHVSDVLVTNLPKFLDAGTKIIVNIADGITKSIPKVIEVASKIITSLTNGITSTIPKLISVATSLIDSFSNFIVANLPKLIESGIKILNNIVQGINNTIPKFLETVNKVVNSFSEYITNNLPKFIDSGVKMLDNIIQGITNNIPKVIESASKIIENVSNTIATNLPKLLDNGVKIISKILEGILTALPKLLSVGLLILENILKTIINNLPKVLEAGIKIVGALAGGILLVAAKLAEVALKLIITLISSLLSNLPQILEAGIKLILALIQGILQVLPQLLMAGLQIILTLIQAIATNLPTILMAGIKIILALIQGIIQALPQILMAALQIIITLVGAIITNLPQILIAGVKIVMALIQGIGSLVFQLLELGLKLIIQLVIGIAKGIPMVIQKAIEIGSGFLNNLIAWFSQLPGRIQSFISNTLSKVVSWGSQMKSKATEIASRFISNIVTYISQLPSRIWSYLSSAASRVVSWGSNLWSAGVNAARRLVDAVVNTASSIPGKMLSIGRNIVQGVWNGITGAASWFYGKISGFFGGLVDKAKSALGIHSPSRVMRDQVGKWIMPGVEVGIDKSMPDLQDNMKTKMINLTKQMKAKVKMETSSLGASIVAKSNAEVTSKTLNSSNNSSNASEGNSFTIQNILDGNIIGEATYRIVDNKLALASRRRR
ncbi:tape measure protein [Clostridium perfringens]|uniref:tape measure protein n=1 Tax=Clostridium perfringens TaxID=1502 RepID=UPI002AC74382|nr:tape measure protein [Clostridium perfringens]MDZ5069180.1 tape measure protein [Clostridium perfringens]MDZ5075412.1 tape measure protein [Clostridium perfringens]